MITIGRLDLDKKAAACLIMAKKKIHILGLEKPGDTAGIQGLIISGRCAEPCRLVCEDKNWIESFNQALTQGMPLFALGYGLLFLAKRRAGENTTAIKGLNITVSVEPVGKQQEDSGEVTIPAYGLKPQRVPGYTDLRITEVGPNVGILGVSRGEPALVRQGNYLGASFYADIDSNLEIFEYFFRMVSDHCRYK